MPKPRMKRKPAKKLIRLKTLKSGKLYRSIAKPGQWALITARGRKFLVKNKLVGKTSLLRQLFEDLESQPIDLGVHEIKFKGKRLALKETRHGRRTIETLRKIFQAHKKFKPKRYVLRDTKTYFATPGLLAMHLYWTPTYYELYTSHALYPQSRAQHVKEFRKKHKFTLSSLRRAIKELIENLKTIETEKNIEIDYSSSNIIVDSYNPRTKKFSFVLIDQPMLLG